MIRIPHTQNHTLKAFNAADELLVSTAAPFVAAGKKVAIIHDRFGYLTCHFKSCHPTVFVHLKSQKDAIQNNLEQISQSEGVNWSDLFSEQQGGPFDVVIVHLPKSLELLEWYCQYLHPLCHEKTIVFWGFMTRHFTPAWLNLAGQYFNEVLQGKAKKKARIITLGGKIDVPGKPVTPKSISFENREYQQFPGVFASGKIDPATLFLLHHLSVKPSEKKVLDWGCGSGIIGGYLLEKYKHVHLDALDDFLPAFHSAKRNLPEATLFWDYEVPPRHATSYDLIVTNPPFHFEYENDITISISFFSQTKKWLSPEGRLVIVANKHLNYKTHLEKIFFDVTVVQENEKFIIYECQKPREMNGDNLGA